MLYCLAIPVYLSQYLVVQEAFDKYNRWKTCFGEFEQHEVTVLRGDRADLERDDLRRYLAFFG